MLGPKQLIDTVVNNVYIKVPENSLSVRSILSAISTKIGCQCQDLVLLDVNFLEVMDDKGDECLYRAIPSALCVEAFLCSMSFLFD